MNERKEYELVENNIHSHKTAMGYTVYIGSLDSEPIFQIWKSDWITRHYQDLDSALDGARHASALGFFPLLIEGPDGTRLTTKEILSRI